MHVRNGDVIFTLIEEWLHADPLNGFWVTLVIHTTIILLPGEASTLRDFLKSLHVLLPVLKLSTVVGCFFFWPWWYHFETKWFSTDIWVYTIILDMK